MSIFELDQKVQPNDFKAAACCSAICLQVDANWALVAGSAASLRHSVRQRAIPSLYCARTISGTLFETHASYFAMKSSHSGTPILSPLFEAVAVAGVLVAAAGLSVLPEAVFELVVVSVFEQASATRASTRHNVRVVVLNIDSPFVD
jgi:hypothetical protein